jgi:hypothetical protein
MDVGGRPQWSGSLTTQAGPMARPGEMLRPVSVASDSGMIGRSKLFDLEQDPDERHDLGREYPERVGAYREHLLRWSANQKLLISKAR